MDVKTRIKYEILKERRKKMKRMRITAQKNDKDVKYESVK